MPIPPPPYTGGMNKIIVPAPVVSDEGGDTEDSGTGSGDGSGTSGTSPGTSTSGSLTPASTFLEPESPETPPVPLTGRAAKTQAPPPKAAGKPPPPGFSGTGEAPEAAPEARREPTVFKHPPPAYQAAAEGHTGMTPSRPLSSFPPAGPPQPVRMMDWPTYTGGAVPPPPAGRPGSSAYPDAAPTQADWDRAAAEARDLRARFRTPGFFERSEEPVHLRDHRCPVQPPARMRMWFFPTIAELRAWENQHQNPEAVFRSHARDCPELSYCFVGSLPEGVPFQPLTAGLPDFVQHVGWCARPCPRPSTSGDCHGRCFRPVYSGSHTTHANHICSGCRGYRH